MSSGSTSVAGITGTPAAIATRRALALSPSMRIVSARRPDEGDAGGGAGVDEVGVLGQQAVARMDRVGAAHLGDADDLGDRQVGGDRPEPLADAIGLVRLEAVQAELVLLGEDRDRALAHLVGGPHDPDGDLAAVGDQDLLEARHRRQSPAWRQDSVKARYAALQRHYAADRDCLKCRRTGATIYGTPSVAAADLSLP